ncbi:Cys-tRNA(Pro) deacylase [Mesobacillus foraminis]|uniref:Cys-tRNA(Pro)/Cys-tRNA(Cys) deacylase n=1 Tax=Mesobacillus foraminis TaxID=279826 RepID=A0A4R2BAM4_9BACI|nr:Cys-tRNA(Pro) deacylase [Mesobacillus foraminis]TCN23988.1 Cys-tRNA(Pro)/Cys-tRNA(Cys) deacylase [Mesobacillus foraminis]
MAGIKTNAMRLLDSQKVLYHVFTYDSKDGKNDGVSVAEKIKKDPGVVFKTLVAQGSTRNLFVFIIQVEDELDLKKAAKASGEKKIEMLPVKDLQKHTGYIRGGCSPLGMKKQYPTIIDLKAETLEQMIVSAGKIGFQVELAPKDLQSLTHAVFADVRK